MNNVTITAYNDLSPELLEELENLEKVVLPTEYIEDRLTSEIIDKRAPICVVAYKNNKAIGFKLGYEKKQAVFYSWLGGVIESERGTGIAGQLMDTQHQQLKALGYKKVQTQSRNSKKEMMRLNLKFGFDIIGTKVRRNSSDLTIIMEKQLM